MQWQLHMCSSTSVFFFFFAPSAIFTSFVGPDKFPRDWSDYCSCQLSFLFIWYDWSAAKCVASTSYAASFYYHTILFYFAGIQFFLCRYLMTMIYAHYPGTTIRCHISLSLLSLRLLILFLSICSLVLPQWTWTSVGKVLQPFRIHYIYGFIRTSLWQTITLSNTPSSQNTVLIIICQSQNLSTFTKFIEKFINI